MGLVRGFKSTIFCYLVLSFALISSSGCRSGPSEAEFAEFAASLDTGLAAVLDYYTSLNERELDLYFEMLELDESLEVGDFIVIPQPEAMGEADSSAADETPVDAIDSPLKKPPFATDAIEMRIRILEELANYGKNLAAISGSKQPQQFKDALGGLENRLSALELAIQRNTPTESLSDPGVSGYLAPLSAIVKIVGNWRMESLRWSALRKTVIKAQPEVDTILDKLAEDFDSYVDPVILTWHDERITMLMEYYNTWRLDRGLEWRHDILGQIRDSKDALDTAESQKPSEIPRQLKRVHTALVESAKSNGSRKDLAQLRLELEIFSEEVNELADAVAVLRGDGKRGSP